MAEDFGDSTGSGLVNTAGQAAKEVRSGRRDKGCGHRRKGRWRHLPLRGSQGYDGSFQTACRQHLPHLPASIWSQSPTSPVR